jgi:hypothetical protein
MAWVSGATRVITWSAASPSSAATIARSRAAGIPAYGLSVVPAEHADALRRFVLSPLRSALLHAMRRPPPFDTYHTRGDASSTLEPRALDFVGRALSAIVADLG